MVVTKLTGALLFILLLTMVIMALLPKAVDLAPPGAQRPGGCRNRARPLAITTPEAYPKRSPGVLTPLRWRPREAAGRCTGTSRESCRKA